jgi:hypothetical protein
MRGRKGGGGRKNEQENQLLHVMENRIRRFHYIAAIGGVVVSVIVADVKRCRPDGFSRY